jgi:hypothetical protein
MLDSQKAGASLRHHFDTVTDAEFIANVKQFNPDLAQELWGDQTVAEILARRRSPVRRGLDRLMHAFRRSRRAPV